MVENLKFLIKYMIISITYLFILLYICNAQYTETSYATITTQSVSNLQSVSYSLSYLTSYSISLYITSTCDGACAGTIYNKNIFNKAGVGWVKTITTSYPIIHTNTISIPITVPTTINIIKTVPTLLIKNCSENCKECNGSLSNQCTSCNSGYNLINNGCELINNDQKNPLPDISNYNPTTTLPQITISSYVTSTSQVPSINIPNNNITIINNTIIIENNTNINNITNNINNQDNMSIISILTTNYVTSTQVVNSTDTYIVTSSIYPTNYITQENAISNLNQNNRNLGLIICISITSFGTLCFFIYISLLIIHNYNASREKRRLRNQQK